MSATSVEQVSSADSFEVEFPSYYPLKAFIQDASKLRDFARMRTRERLSEDDIREVAELRKRIRRADADAVLLKIIEVKANSGFVFF
jgi:hypothetical protein